MAWRARRHVRVLPRGTSAAEDMSGARCGVAAPLYRAPPAACRKRLPAQQAFAGRIIRAAETTGASGGRRTPDASSAALRASAVAWQTLPAVGRSAATDYRSRTCRLL